MFHSNGRDSNFIAYEYAIALELDFFNCGQLKLAVLMGNQTSWITGVPLNNLHCIFISALDKC